VPKPKAFGASFAASPAEISVLVLSMTASLLSWAEDMELTLKRASKFFEIVILTMHLCLLTCDKKI
jgi:hypothetical protein